MSVFNDDRNKALGRLQSFTKNRGIVNRQISNQYYNTTPYGQSRSYDGFDMLPGDKEYLEESLKDINKETEKPEDISIFEHPIDWAIKQGSDVANSLRTWTQRLSEQFVDDDIAKIDNITQETQDLNLIKEYVSFVDQLNKLDGALIDPDIKEERREELIDKISQLDEYFKGEGRHHTAIAQLMYNPNNLTTADKVAINGMYASRDDNTITGSILNKADWLLTTIGQGVLNLFGQGDEINGYKTGEVVKKLTEHDFGGPGVDKYFMDKLYIGSDSNKGFIKNQLDLNRVNKWLDYNDSLQKELTIDLQNDIDFAKTGKLNYYINTTNNNHWWQPNIDANVNISGILNPITDGKLFNPEDIPELFKKDQEKYSSEWYSAFIHPIYTFPETASTVGLFKHQLGASTGDMLLNGALAFVAKRFPTFATILTLEAALIAGSTSLAVEATKRSREDETGLEKIQALQKRMLTDMRNHNVNTEDVFNQIKRYATNTLHLDPKKLDDKVLLELAIAYHIPITTPGYDEITRDSRRGIEKVVNQNNALAIHDFLESLPFLNYGGKALKRALDRRFSKAAFGAAAPLAERQLAEQSSAIAGGVIDKISRKFIANDMPKLGLMAKHTGEFALNKLKLGAYEGFMESGEEGAQEIILSRYRRGEYDDYNKAESMFDVDEIMQVPGLYKDAILDYFGLNSGDPDNGSENVRRAMNIGFSSSFMFSQGMTALSNVRNDPYANNSRQLILQLKADRLVGNLVGTYAEQAQDHAHIATFFDAYAKNNKRGAHIITALNDLKKNVDENNSTVKKSDIDADIKLARASYSLYNNDAINSQLKENGIKKNSDRHKQLVIDGTTAIVDAQMTGELVDKNRSDYRKNNDMHIDLLDTILSDRISEEDKQRLLADNPHFASMIQTLKDNYGLFKDDWISSRNNEIQAVKAKYKTDNDYMIDEDFVDWALLHDIDIYNGITDDVKTEFAKSIVFNNKSGNLNNEKNFKNNSFIRAFIQSKHKDASKKDLPNLINEAYQDKLLRDEAIRGAYELYNKGNIDENSYLRQHLHLFHFHTKVKQTKKALDIAKNRLERLKTIRKYTGLDVNTDKLDGIVTQLQKMYDSLVEKEDIIVNGRHEKEKEDGSKRTLEDFFGRFDLQFDDQQEYEQQILQMLMNSAAYIPQMLLAKIYMFGTTDNLRGLQDAIYGENIESSLIKDDVDEYLKKEALILNADDLDADVSQLDKEASRVDMKKISKKAAWKIINGRLDEAEKRLRISRRNAERDLGLPEGSLSQEEQLESQDVSSENRSRGRKSDNRKKFEHDVMHGTGEDKQSGRERLQEEMDKRNSEQPVQEDDQEDDEYDDEYDENDDYEIDEDDVDDAELDEEDDEEDDQSQHEVDEEKVEVLPPGHPNGDSEITPIYNQETADSPVEEDVDQEDLETVETDDEDEDHTATEMTSPSVEEDETDLQNEAADEDDEEQDDVLRIISDMEDEAEMEDMDIMDDSIVSISNLDALYFDEEDEIWYYEDEPLDENQAKAIEDELILLELLETVGITLEMLPDGTNQDASTKRILATKESIGDLISHTFFYQPESETTIDLKVKGKLVLFDKPIASGKQLAQKLIQKGWLASTKKYYVVSQSLEGLQHYGDPRDTMTVVLCLEDESNTYIVSLRQLGATISQLNYKGKKAKSKEELAYLDAWIQNNEHGVFKDAESDLRAWLEMRNVNWDLVLSGGQRFSDESSTSRQRLRFFREAVMKKAKSIAMHSYLANHSDLPEEKALSQFEAWWEKGVWVSSKSNIDPKVLRQLAIDRARESFALPGKNVLTQKLILLQIDKLREFRNSIIDLYTTKEIKDGKTVYKISSKAKKTVVPESVTQSNGRFDNVKENGNPVFRAISDDNMTVDDIQNQINSGELTFGYGTGVFGHDQYKIKGVLNSDTETNFDGRGLSGKIYLFVSSLADLAKRIPMMLSEERFDSLQKEDGTTVYRDQIKLCLDPNDMSNTNINGYKPSAAEVLLYMLCDKIDMGGMDYDKRREVIEFFIHSGETTLLSRQPKYKDFPIKPFASKQLNFDRESKELTIALPNGVSADGKPIYIAQTFSLEDLFGEDSEETRLKVVHAIASQMHWNTDIAHMNNNTNVGSVALFIMQLAQQDARDGKISQDDVFNHTIEIFGCPQLSFKISDLFDKTSTGVSPKSGITNLAWMIKNKKLMTDVSKELFYAPFVFAYGVKSQQNKGSQVQQETELKLKPENKQIIKTGDPVFSLFDQPKLDWVRETFGVEDELEVASNDDLAKTIIESLQSQSQAKENNGFRDRILFAPPKESMAIEEGYDHFFKRLDEFIENYNNKHPDNKISRDNVEINSTNEKRLRSQYGALGVYAIVNIFNNGKIKIVFNNVDNSWKNKFTGIFSSKRLKGKFDETYARNWLSEKLGIDQANVIVTNAVMKSMTDEVVFGLTNVCTDVLSDSLTGYIVLSTNTGTGVTYHEAWHYVNLLMHNSQERQALYRDFIKTHKYLNKKGVTILDVEEAMADAFAEYVEALNDNSLTGKVKRLFNNVLDFLSISRKRSLYRNAFKSLQNGEYKGQKLDQTSVEQFHDKYKLGIAQVNYALPGLTYKETQNLESIDTYQEYYDAFRSVANYIIIQSNINTVEELLAYTKEHENFQEVLDMIQEMRDVLDQDEDKGYAILTDLLNNPALVKKMFKETMLELGLKSKVKRVEDVTSSEDPDESDSTKREDLPDNVWDRVELTMSKKDNAAIRTKLFFRTIPLLMPNVLPDGTILFVENLDDYGVLKMWSFDESWNILLNELFSATSFGDKDENGYLKSSIMGKVERLKDSSNFWNAVYTKLLRLDSATGSMDILLKSLIFSTMCSSKNQVSFIQLQNPYAAMDMDEDFEFEFDDSYDYDDEDSSISYESDELLADRTRRWSLMGDNALIVARSVPRRWSQNLVSKGFVRYDIEKGKSMVNDAFVDALKSKYNALYKKINTNIKDTKTFSYKDAMFGKDGILNGLMDMLQYVGIPADVETINVFISMSSDIKSARSLTAKEQFDTLKKLFSNTSQGSIPMVILSLIQSKNKEAIPMLGRSTKERQFDEAFNNYKPGSQIGMLAMAYNMLHPNLADYSTKGPNGDTYYPINQNNFITGQLRAINDKQSGRTEELRRSKYCAASLILSVAEQINPNDESTQIRLNTFVGMKDADKAKGADYFGITDMEDYLAKMYMTELDHIVFPTMADKKTWYSLSSSNLKLVHDIVINKTPIKFRNKAIYEEYEKVNPYDESKNNSKSAWRSSARAWYYGLRDLEKDDEGYDEANMILKRIDRRSSDILSEQDLINIGLNRFSDETLSLFSNYFLSELDTLEQYYDRRHIQHIVNNENDRIENYHGKVQEVEIDGVKQKRLDWSGNGGKFRYFYDVFTFKQGGKTINLNQKLQALYELLKKIEKGIVKNKVSKDELYKYVGVGLIQETGKDGKLLPLDGFEMIRAEIKKMQKEYRDMFNQPTDQLKDAINKKLFSMVDDEIEFVTKPGSPFQLGEVDKNGYLIPKSIPQQMLNRYLKVFQERELTDGLSDAYDSSSLDIQHQIFYNLIASYALNTMISTIEVEKIFSGDSAFYKWKENKADSKVKFNLTHSIAENGNVSAEMTEQIEVENLDDTYSDKIKRLGGTLSPGAEMRLDFSDIEMSKPENKTLASSHYTVLNVEDIKVPSSFLDEIEDMFRKQLVVDWIRCENPKQFKQAVEKAKEAGVNVGSFEHQIDLVYNNNRFYLDILKSIPAKKRREIESMLKKQISPYEGITVADALVFIRPELYRKIKIGLGEWLFKPDNDGYSDEVAYQLIENNTYKGKKIKEGQWMSDPALYKIVKKFQTNTLKMSYFLNAATQLFEDSYVNKPIYNKMAIFPLFKYHRSTNIGNELYSRMNDSEKGEIDMITFKSAVKVGAVQSGPSFVERTKVKRDDKGNITNLKEIRESAATLSSVINNQSQKRVDYYTDETIQMPGENTLPISIQDLKELRLQLNTHAHESTDRNIGSLMFKLAFSNIIDDAMYGTGKSGRKARTGLLVKQDIMRCINNLTDRGINKLRTRFYKTIKNNKGENVTVVDQDEVRNFVTSVIEGNGLGVSAEDIIASGGVVASLMLRTIFEQSASALINSEVVDIKTKGGTAIQQSMYGFASLEYDNKSVNSDAVYVNENDEKLDKLIHKDTTKLNLSVQLLKKLNDLELYNIKDILENKYKIDRLSDKYRIEIQELLDGLNLTWNTPTQFKRKNLYVQYNDGKELKWSAKEGSMEVLLSMNFFKSVVPEKYLGSYSEMREWLIEHDVIKGIKKDGTKSNPKPFGIGYRIPTQGMSSMFGFIVADVLPEQVGDLIVVPREFTAQTGSDFDVDKLYLATYSYLNGEREVESFLKGVLNTTGAVSNTLLDNYLDVITDPRNYSNARASIDVITDIIQDELLSKVLKSKRPGYRKGMSQLLPSFQCSRKREFGVGKTGIGPFALNITNMALTQYSHLTFDYGENEYKFGHLDLIYGDDGLRISDWLSAMVNAHVDVAKDAYVFDLNVNNITYNHTNFLLRAGKGKKTFLFLAQPYLKRYSELLLNAGGMYGGYIDLEELDTQYNVNKKIQQRNKLIGEIVKKITALAEKYNDEWTKEQASLIHNVLYYYTRMITPDRLREEKGLKDVVDRIEAKDTIFSDSDSVFKVIKSGVDNRAENAIKNINSENFTEKMDALIFLLYSIEAFDDIDPYAQAISNLVLNSKIDTKKFGNNIASLYNFQNNMMQFRCTGSIWTINDPEFVKSLPKQKGSDVKEKDPDANTISKFALERYFREMYLDKKFNAALKYECKLLDGQIFKASSLYRSIYFAVCRNIQGESTVEDAYGNVYHGYNRIYKDEVVQSIANGIDDIMRYNAFMAVGFEEYQKLSQSNPDVIDFTMGNNQDAVRDNIKRLLFGIEQENENTGQIEVIELSIFNRVSKLIDDMKSNPRNPAYRRYVNRNGQITNDLLLYITPFSPNSKFPIGRMLLQESLSVIKGDRKGRLVAAFAELLTSSDENIRKIAQDLAFYAYFSTYDLNTRNSFFDLVPARFRQQYDRSLKHVLNNVRSKNTNTQILVLRQITGNQNIGDDFESALQNAANTIIDVLSRNYWYDNNYVPSFMVPKNSGKSFLRNGGTIYGEPKYIKEGGVEFPTWIASSRVSGESLYIKVHKRGETMLYRRTGTIQQTKHGKLGEVKGAKYGIYTPVPKAGVHQGKLNLFELYCDYETQSIFDSNIISKVFAEDIVRADIESKIEKDNDGDWNLNLSWERELIPCAYMSDNLYSYSPVEEREHTKINGATFTFVKGANYVSNNRADIIIDINNIVTEEPGKNISSKHTDKRIAIGLEDNPSSIIELIKKLAEGHEESGVVVSFSTQTYDNHWNIPLSYIEDAIEEALSEYSSTLDGDENTIKAQLDVKRELLKNDRQFKTSISMRYVSEKISNIISAIEGEISIKQVSTSTNNGLTMLSLSLANLHKTHANEYVDHSTRIYADMDLKRKKYKAKNLREQLLELFAEAEGMSNESHEVIQDKYEDLSNGSTEQDVVDQDQDVDTEDTDDVDDSSENDDFDEDDFESSFSYLALKKTNDIVQQALEKTKWDISYDDDVEDDYNDYEEDDEDIMSEDSNEHEDC